MTRSETSVWLGRLSGAVRSSYRVCPACGDRAPSPEQLHLHRVRVCRGGEGSELVRLGGAGPARTPFATNEILEVIR